MWTGGGVMPRVHDGAQECIPDSILHDTGNACVIQRLANRVGWPHPEPAGGS